jgi:hypothetical protein
VVRIFYFKEVRVFVEIESDDRAAVERIVLSSLWQGERVRLTTVNQSGRYSVSLNTVGNEPDVPSVQRATS